MSVPFIVLLDLDDTVFAAKWRDGLKPCEDGEEVAPALWDNYNRALIDDQCIPGMVDLVRNLQHNGHEIWGVTSRPEKWRSITMYKCRECGVTLSLLLMRPNEETGVRSPILKPALVVEALRDRYGPEAKVRDYVSMVIEDRADVTEAFRALGVLVLQVHFDQERLL